MRTWCIFIFSGLCVDTLQHDDKDTYNVGIYACHQYVTSSQFFSFSREFQLRREDSCAVLGEDSDRIHGMGREIVRMIPCVKGDENQQWIHTKQVNPALHKAHLLPPKILCSLFQIFEVPWGSLGFLEVP